MLASLQLSLEEAEREKAAHRARIGKLKVGDLLSPEPSFGRFEFARQNST